MNYKEYFLKGTFSIGMPTTSIKGIKIISVKDLPLMEYFTILSILIFSKNFPPNNQLVSECKYRGYRFRGYRVHEVSQKRL